jgi:hypothetical protein
MKKDKPERKITANPAKGIVATTLPAKMERTEFLKRLVAIPTNDGTGVVETKGLMKTITNAFGSVWGGGGGAVPSKVLSTPPPSRRLDVMFEIVHPESPICGPLKLMIQDTEQLQNLRQTFIDIGIGTTFVFRYHGSLISSTKTLRDISYDTSKKIYLGAGIEPVVQVVKAAVLPAAPIVTSVSVSVSASESESKKPCEDPLVATARGSSPRSRLG